MRYLALDLGARRTGLAVGDDETGIVSPAGLLEVPPGPALLEAITARIDEHRPDGIVVGLPLHADGRESDGSRAARVFGAQLEERCGLPVRYQDERLTSFAAEEQLGGSGRTHRQKKARRDALAAAEILRDYLAARG